MKHTLYITLLTVLVAPTILFAHTSTNQEYTSTQPHMMMFEIEDKILDDATHEKMEELMEKMMLGTLTEDELDELAVFGGQYPVPYTMMFNRFSNNPDKTPVFTNLQERNYMMGYGGHHRSYYGTGNFVGLFTQILILTILILIIAVLAKWIRKSN